MGSRDDRPGDKSPAAFAQTQATPEDRVTSPVFESDGKPIRAFQENDFVGGRYRVLRFIARGGMGEVYEVEDVELRSRVALKTIRPESADDETSLERFRREIDLARKVTHPNVCRIFDLGHHQSPRGRVTFLTMELLEGESLLRRLRSRGPLPTAEALPIVEQMAAALNEAHTLGIVHRDFKSDNVMLVATPTGSSGVRAVVTDFGLARSAAAGASTTRSGQLVGTPTYMAPEQLEGGAVGPLADLYALGVVMYEMVTGQVPFTGENAFSVAVKRLHKVPARPRTHVPTLDKRWDEVILRCLERDPKRRFASVKEVVAALHDRGRPVALPRSKTIWFLAGGAMALLGGAGGLVLRARGPAPTSASAAAAAHRAVAVMGLRNLSQRPESAWLGTALSELLSGELSADDRLRCASAQSVTQLKRDLTLRDGESLSAQTLKKVRSTLDVDYTVGGSYLEMPGGQLRLDLALQDTQSGETLVSVNQSGREGELSELVARAGRELRERLGSSPLSAEQAAGARVSLPADPEAARPYAQGLDKLRLSDAQGARPLLDEVAKRDPAFTLVHLARADVFAHLGRAADESAAAKRAFEGAATLPRHEQLLVEARYRVTLQEWPRAIELYRALFEFYPDAVEYGLALASVQVRAAQAADALATLTIVGKQAPRAAGDPRVDLVRMRAEALRGDFPAAARAGARTLELARALGARQLVAETLLSHAYPLSGMGERDQARAMAAEASRIYDELGDAHGQADAMQTRGNLAWKAGALTDALAQYDQALAMYRQLGADGRVAGVENDRAGVLDNLGRRAEAQRAYEAGLALARQVGDHQVEVSCLLGIGRELHLQRRYEEARTRLQDALAQARVLGTKKWEAVALEHLGVVRRDLGDLRGALDAETQAIAGFEAIADQAGAGNAKSKLAGFLGLQGEEARAATLFADARAILSKVGEKTSVARVARDQAELALSSGRLAEAETQARAAVEALAQAKAAPLEAAARGTLARTLLAGGKTAEARAEIDRALAGAQDDVDVQTTAAAVELAEGHAAQAVARLTPVVARANLDKVGAIVARRVLAQAERAAGHDARGAKREQAAVDEARTAGLVTLTRPIAWSK